MGFFSDLKEDLSQAVNELMPDELTTKTVEEESVESIAEESSDAGVALEEVADNAEDAFSVELSLEEMLKNIDSIQLPEDYEMQPETTSVTMDASLEAALAAALESIPDENGVVAFAENVSEVAAEPEEEKVTEEPVMDSLAEFASGMEELRVEEPVKEEIVAELPDMEESIAAYAAIEAQEPAPEDTTVIEEIEDKGADDKMDSYTNRQATDETAVITAGMQIKGDITSEGSVDVVGTVDGNIEVWGKLNITGHVNGNSHAAEIYAEGAKINGEIVSSGAVKIGNSSVIIGNITAKSAAIAGAVKGDIDVQGPVVLDASAIVMGNIKSKSVQINNGAVIEGMCSQCYAEVNPLSFFDEYKTEIKNSKKNK